MANPAHRAAICPKIAYVPQGLGTNLCGDLTIREKIEFYDGTVGTGSLMGWSRFGLLEQIWRAHR